MLSSVDKTDVIRVVSVEDDEDYREIVGGELAEKGFCVQSFPDGASLIAAPWAIANTDVILLDWNLPAISGIDLLPQRRQCGVSLPVVFLTGRSLTTAQERLAFERGAVDFIDKARGVEIVGWRLRRVAEAHKPAANLQAKAMVCRELVLQPAERRAYGHRASTVSFSTLGIGAPRRP